MKIACRALLALLLAPAICLASGADMRRADRRITSQCKSIGSTPQEFFEITCSSCQAQDRKSIWFSQFGVNHSSSSILISSFSTVAQTQAFPLWGLMSPELYLGPSARVFVSRSVSEVPTTITVCGMQLE